MTSKSFDLTKLSKASDGFTGAEIEEVIKSTMFRGYADGARKINTTDLLTEINTVVPQSKVNEADIRAMREGAKGKLRIAGEDGTAQDLEKVTGRKIKV